MSRRSHDDSGAALIEFALVLPLLLLLVFGIVDFGRAINYWIDETHLANEAARFAAVGRNPAPSGNFQDWIAGQAVTKELREGSDSVGGGGLKVCLTFPNGPNPKVGEPLEVRVSTTFNWLPFLNAETGLTSTEIAGSSTMRLEARKEDFEAGLAAGCSS
jgi:Flp pilus assembly pilin Flp